MGEPCNFDADPCICATKNFTLDLRSFMDSRKGKDLQAIGEANSYTYYVQPCNRKLSNQIQACNNVSLDLTSCQLDAKTKQLAYGLGLINKFDATQDKDNFILTNSFMAGNTNRTLHLTVKCSKQFLFTYEGSSGTLSPITYKFTLATSHVCSGGNNDGNEGGLSPGSIMVIIFFVLLIVYILGGLLFQIFVRKAQGAEMLPNYIFWKEFPFLVKDGFVFTFQCCKGSSGYDKI
ncbi:hypothetical protein BsWGS_00603 [Bradybaena similaris]